MKTVVIIAERLTQSALSAVVPADGVVSVRVTRHQSPVGDKRAAADYQSLRNPRRFNPAVRIAMVVEDGTAETVFEAVSVAHGAGFFSDAEMWTEAPAFALSA